jgi:tetratricopeptide (TPR) repeat protein
MMLQGLELIDWRNKDEVIKFYEANILYFDNYQVQTQLDSILNIIDIKLSYCDALISKKHYTDCLEILTHINILINKLKQDQKGDYKIRYERYLFTEAVVFAYLKRYEESQTNFKELLRIDPRNDVYKDWFESMKARVISKQSNIIGYMGFGIIFLDIITSTIFKIKLGKFVSLVGFLTMTIGFSYPYILRQLKKLI